MKIETFHLSEELKDVTLTAYILEDSPEMLNGGKRPAVLICPGGAYMYISDREGEPVALRFAAMGYHAFVLKYSVYSNCGLKFPDLNKPAYKPSTFPEPVQEIGKAMMIIHEHADEWLVDTDRIVLNGYSAGAHNCAMYSVYWNTDVITSLAPETPEIFRPCAAVLGYGMYDYINVWKSTELSPNPFAMQMHKGMCMASVGVTEFNEEIFLKSSPARLINSDTPPMFLWACADDSVVNVQETLNFAIQLSKNHIPFEVRIYESGDHGLSLADEATANAWEQVDPHVALWMNDCEKWLRDKARYTLPEKGPVFDIKNVM